MNFRSDTPYNIAHIVNINIGGLKKAKLPCLCRNWRYLLEKALFYMTLGKELIMWDDDPDMMDAFEEEYDYESESDDGLDDLAFDSVIAADVDDGAFDNDGEYFDDED